MKKLITIFLLSLWAFHLDAQLARVINSEIRFTIKNTGINVDGIISGLKAEINFNINDLKNSQIKASLDPATIDTGIGMRDNHLKKEGYFHIEKYNSIEIQSKDFKKIESDDIEGIFELTIKGITKELTIPFSIKKTDNGLTEYNAQFTVNRQDFNIGSNSIVLSDEVKVWVIIITD